MWLTVIVILAAAGLVINAWFTLRRLEKQWTKKTLSPDEHDRMVVHEVGHVVVAWMSNAVTSIDGVERTPVGAHTRFHFLDDDGTGSLQEQIAICMAGAAAEHLCFAGIDWDGCSSDVLKAVRFARLLKRRESPEATRMRLRAHAPQFPEGFAIPADGGTDEQQTMLLLLGLIEARERIIAYHAGFDRLREIAYRKRDGKVILTREDIESCFGPRIWAPK